MDSGIAVINTHKHKINSKLSDNIFAIEGKAIFNSFYRMIKLNILQEKIYFFLSKSTKSFFYSSEIILFLKNIKNCRSLIMYSTLI